MRGSDRILMARRCAGNRVEGRRLAMATLARAVLIGVLGAGLMGAQEGDLRLVGEAVVDGEGLRLTPAAPQTSGAAWLEGKRRLAEGFRMRFRFRIAKPGGLGGGADGIAFVVQNGGPEALGGPGSAGGFAVGNGGAAEGQVMAGRLGRREQGVARALAVFFDTYRNASNGDPSDNYVSLCTNGESGRMRWPPARLAASKRVKGSWKDGADHEAEIRYRPPYLSVRIDGEEPVLNRAVDLRGILDGEGAAWVGFTASTGNGYADHYIVRVDFRPGEPKGEAESVMTMVDSELSFPPERCLSGRPICTPPEAEVKETGPGRWHVLLPAHKAWAAGVPVEEGWTVVVSGRRGFACWDSAAGNGCSGPGGVRVEGKWLDNEQPAGALLMRRAGRKVEFSVNGRAGKAMGSAEGYYEFDVELKPAERRADPVN